MEPADFRLNETDYTDLSDGLDGWPKANLGRTVYKVQRVHDQRMCVLKLIFNEGQEVEEFLRGCEREAEAPCQARGQNGNNGQIAQRHVIDVLDHGRYSGPQANGQTSYAIVMEWVEAGLHTALKEATRLPAEQAVSLAATIAAAVQACHACQPHPIVHRDLKPANILLRICNRNDPGACLIGDNYYQPVLTDFGLVKFINTEQTEGREDHGTRAFMAPEQFIPKMPHDRPIDIYALGVILYRSLTGEYPTQTPFSQHTVFGKTKLVSESNRQPSDCPYDPAWLDRVCQACLWKLAKDRIAAGQLAEDLRRCAANLAPLHSPKISAAARTADEVALNPVRRAERETSSWRGAWLKRAAIALGAAAVVTGVIALAWIEAKRGRARLLLDGGMTQVRAGDPGFGALLIAQSMIEAPPVDRAYRTVAARAVASARAGLHPLVNIVPGTGLVRAAPVWQPAGDAGIEPLVLLPDNQGQVRYLDPRSGQLEDESRRRIAVVPVDATSEQARQLQKSLTCATLAPDGKRFAVASAAGLVTLFDTASASVIWQSTISDPRSITFTSDGKAIWVAGYAKEASKRLSLLNAATGRQLRSLPAGIDLNALALSHDGRLIAVAGRGEGRIEIWGAMDESPTKPITTFSASGTVFCLTFNSSRILVSGDVNGEVRFWDPEGGREIGLPLRHDAQVRVTTFDPSGQWLLTGAEDGVARVWHAESRQPTGQRLLHAADIRAGALTHDRIVTVDFRGETRVWRFNPDGGDVMLRHPAQVRDAAFDPTGTRVITGCADAAGMRGAGRVWSAVDSKQPPAVLPVGSETLVARFHPSNPLTAATGDNRGFVHLWTLAPGSNGVKVAELRNAGGLIRSLAFSPPDGRYLAYTGRRPLDDTSKPAGPVMYDIVRKTPTQLDHPPFSHGWNVSFAPNGTAMVADGGPVAAVWQLSGTAGASPAKLRSDLSPSPNPLAGSESRSGNPPDVMGSVIHPDGSRVLVWDETQFTAIYPLTGGPAMRLSASADGHPPTPAHAARISGAVFVPNTPLAVTAAADGEATVWDTTARPTVVSRMIHGSPVLAIAASSDGKLLATGTQDGIARLWSLPDGKWTGCFRSHRGPITRIAFAPGDRLLLTASNDWTARVTTLPEREAVEELSPASLIAKIEQETGIAVVVAETNSDAAHSPPRVLNHLDWNMRWREKNPPSAGMR